MQLSRDAAAWKPLPPRFRLGGDELHVVRASSSEADRLDHRLTDDERRRAARFQRAADAKRFIAARGVLRDLLVRVGAESCVHAELEPGARGKPALPARGAPRFNISHSGQVVLVAIARFEVGVDVEAPPSGDAVELARQAFGMGAADTIAAMPSGRRSFEFLRRWTAYEARLKCSGGGIGEACDDALAAHELALGDGYVGAVAAERSAEPRLWSWMP